MIEIVKEDDSGHRFYIKSDGGHILLSSVEFSSKAEAEKTAQILCTKGLAQYLIERKTDHEGKFLFNLKNNEGTVLGQSQLYGSEAGMENGIKNLTNRVTALGGIDQL